ncbi:MAG TPA: hypothetical protein VMZ28_10880 [Kofleriaceae bacterium]|nr:hypothetical protein [Kofleriaceae bacterium]
MCACGGGDDDGGGGGADGGADADGGGGGGFSGEPGTLWVSSFPADSVLEIDASNGEVLGSFALADEPGNVAVGGGSTWVINYDESRQLARVTASGDVEQLDVFSPYDVAYGEGAVWVTQGAQLVRVDPADGVIETPVDLENDQTLWNPVAVGDGAVWVPAGDELIHVDPGTNARVDAVDIAAEVPDLQRTFSQVAVGEGAAWVLAYTGSASDGTRVLLKIDPATHTVVDQADLAWAGANDHVAAGGGAVWVTDEYAGAVTRFDPDTLDVDEAITLGGGGTDGPSEIVIGAGAAWISDYGSDRILRVDLDDSSVAVIPLEVSPSDLALE